VSAHRALTSQKRAPLPVLCIGNLTVGGTGKTPAAKYFARGLAERGIKPAVLMRGYKQQASDEAREVENAVKPLGVPVLIGGDRFANACKAKELGRDCVLLDDGFQHWKLARDLDIVLIDSTNPFGGEHLIPNGRLREPIEGLNRAGIVILTRCDLSDENDLRTLEKRILTLTPNAIIARAQHRPVELREYTGGVRGESHPLSLLKSTPCWAVCGIGNPAAFLKTLLSLETKLLGTDCLSDHHTYDAYSFDFEILPILENAGAKAMVVTEKDAVKYEDVLCGNRFPIYALIVNFEIIQNEAQVWDRVMLALKKQQGAKEQ
jgi:tetraacyldisaccharide 4'-kinase